MDLQLPLLTPDMHPAVYRPPRYEKLSAIELMSSTARGELHWAPRPGELELVVGEIRESMMPHGPQCPDCGSTKIVRNGRRKGVQRYRCKACKRCFTDLTGTILEGMHHRDRFLPFCLCMIRGYSVREAAAEIGISKNTSFEWRHRIISRLEQNDLEQKLSGIMEISQWPVVISEKSNVVYPFRLSDTRLMSSSLRHKEAQSEVPEWRRAYLIFGVDRMGRARCELFDPATGEPFSASIREMSDQGTLVCVCREPGMWPWANEYPKGTYWVGLSQGRRRNLDYNAGHPLYHSMNARSVQLKFRNWMRRFRGVSEHYLLRYASWYWRVFGFSYMDQQYAAKALFFDALKTDVSAVS